MDSLLANYASSDEEQEEASVEQRTNPPPNQKQAKKIEVEGEKIEDFLSENTSKSIKFSLPPPKSSSSFSLHPPKPHQHKQEDSDDSDDDDRELQRVENRENSKTSSLFSSLAQPKSSSSLFSSLPPPKTHVSDPQPSPSPKPKPNTAPDPVSGTSAKRVVQFRPPLNPSLGKYRDFDDEDEDEEEQAKRRKKVESSGQTASVKSFLSSIPAPKNSATLGALPSASGTGRRSIVETSNSSSVSGGSEVGGSGNMGGDNDGGQYVDGAPMSSSGGVSGSLDYTVGGGSSSGGDYSNWGAGNENYVNYDGNTGYGNVDYSNWSAANGDYQSYGSDSGSYGNYGQYENNWSDGSTTLPAESELRLSAKRGRKDAPPQIVEVNQDELMKNRPREDQAKLTGIAFGPSYQPVSTKGKPTKLHKRKHQIGSLYFDMKQKEMELAERRAKGFLTKAQTQGKYGW